jgi:hypothetical protein
MLTLSDLIQLACAVFGASAVSGGAYRQHGVLLGLVGVIAGWIAGAVVGDVVCEFPKRRRMRKAKKALGKLRTEMIRDALYDDGYWNLGSHPIGRWPPSLLLFELRAREEDITRDLGRVLSLLGSESHAHRVFAFAALRSAYPQLADRIMRRYNPTHSPDECRRIASTLIDTVDRPPPGDAPGAPGEHPEPFELAYSLTLLQDLANPSNALLHQVLALLACGLAMGGVISAPTAVASWVLGLIVVLYFRHALACAAKTVLQRDRSRYVAVEKDRIGFGRRNVEFWRPRRGMWAQKGLAGASLVRDPFRLAMVVPERAISLSSLRALVQE